MLAAEVVKDYVQTVMLPGVTTFAELETLMSPLLQQGRSDVMAEGVAAEAITLQPLLDMRYRGQSYELMIPLSAEFQADFRAIHTRAYGYDQPERPIEIVNLRLRAIGHLPQPTLQPQPLGQAGAETACFARRTVVLSSGLAEVPFYDGTKLRPGHQFAGPAIVIHPDTTIFMEPDDQARLDQFQNLIVQVNTV
jgi:N-methylhydantoinase A